jgi:hypothetical protein
MAASPLSRLAPRGRVFLEKRERFPAEATVALGGVGLSLEIKGEIELE